MDGCFPCPTASPTQMGRGDHETRADDNVLGRRPPPLVGGEKLLLEGSGNGINEFASDQVLSPPFLLVRQDSGRRLGIMASEQVCCKGPGLSRSLLEGTEGRI